MTPNTIRAPQRNGDLARLLSTINADERQPAGDPASGAVGSAALLAREHLEADALEAMLTPDAPFAVLVGDEANALEYAAGQALPVAVWHQPEDGPWRRVPLLEGFLESYFEHLTAWLAQPDAVRTAPEVVEGEASLAASSGLRVIPAAVLPTLVATTQPVLQALAERIQRTRRPADGA